MNARKAVILFSVLLALVLLDTRESGSWRSNHPPDVRLMRTPDGGIQPQGIMDHDRTLHLIYFKGDPAGGDIFYVRWAPGQSEFSPAVRVNSQPGSAIAIGTVRGPQMAVGRQGRVHVVWMGSKTAEPRGPEGATPILYSRLNDRRTAFEPQRNVMQFAVGADGGVSVAADRSGYVYVTWHGRGDTPGEANRRVWVARSKDAGESFEREVAANREPTGACGCCGMRAFADRQGSVYILYRAATEGVERDMVLLVSRDHGKSFEATRVHRWHLNACPMTTAAIVRGPDAVEVAWETAGQVYYGRLESDSLRVTPIVAAPGERNDRKHPALAEDAQGDTLLAWTEGTGWNKGGSLAWQVFDHSGHPTDVKGHADGVPVWGLSAVFAVPGGQFTIIY